MTDITTPEWLDSPLGEALLDRETHAVAEALQQVFGLSLLQVGCWGAADSFVAHARTRHAALVAARPGPGVDCVAEPTHLGIASDSVDAVLLPHTLELHREPHKVLREASRVLVGDGHLVIVGFNPWSPFGLRRLLARRRFPRETRRLIGEKRLRDWMSLLGFEICAVDSTAFLVPVNRVAVQSRMPRVEDWIARYLTPFAGVYVITAQKRVYGATPLRPAWSRKPRVAAGLVEPTTRSAA
ncbi:MAG: methyltransferase domain-containing protein [Gammaproteobacteria bacterium]|nr:methyltransferase domain-containing protein [Gammaproteobacteria bacterium]